MTTSAPLPIDHIGIAVKDLETAIRWYQDFMGGTVSLREELPDQGVSLVFINTPTSKIELLAPLRADCALGRFLDKRGPGLHHICYAVTNIEAELSRLTREGKRLIDTSPRLGAGGSKIAFIHPDSCMGVLTELCEHTAK